jgi:hypothetical protein
MRISRRQLMGSLGIAAVASRVRAVADDAGTSHGKKGEPCPLALSEFQPKSMLHVSQTRVERARFPRSPMRMPRGCWESSWKSRGVDTERCEAEHVYYQAS